MTQTIERKRAATRARKSALWAGVGLAHVGLFLLLGRAQPLPFEPPLPPIMVELIDLTPPPEPPPPPAPAATGGGGAPAAPSRVNIVPDPPRIREPEIITPPVQAPEPDPVLVGASPIATPEPGWGQGGQGTGTGSGIGPGSGPGQGGTPPRLVTGPTQAQLRTVHPPAALRAGRAGRASLRCTIGLDTLLRDCRVLSENPPGDGFGQAALVASRYFRFRPPTQGGRPVPDQEVTVGVEFGRQDRVR